MTEATIGAIIKGIEEDLLDRRGLGNELEQCDADVRREIRVAWRKIIERALADGRGA